MINKEVFDSAYRIQLNAFTKAEAQIDIVGSGGWIPTLSTLLVTALDIAGNLSYHSSE